MCSLFYLIHEHFFFAKKKIGSLQTIESTMADIGPKWVFENIESKRKAMNRNWCNQKANPALNTKAGNK